jgi:lysozyme
MNEHLKVSAFGLEHITKWEGLMLKRYNDIAGIPTIGVGHVILPGEKYQEITKVQAMEILAKDVERFEKAVKKYITTDLNQNQFDALVSFIFNTGEGGIINSNVQKSVNSGNFAKVPASLEEWSKFRVNGVMKINKGLLNRRKSEAQLFMKPTETAALPQDASVLWDKNTLKEAQTYLSKICLYDKSIDGLWGPGTSNGLTQFASQHCISLGDEPKTKIPRSVFALLKEKAS